MSPEETVYRFSFTASSLRPEMLTLIAQIWLRTSCWDQTKQEVLENNVLQCRSAASAVRLERELRQRLQSLTENQIQLFEESNLDDRLALAWLAAVKHSSFLFEFSSEVLRRKIDTHDLVLRVSDYEHFIEEKSAEHPELVELTDTTTRKIHTVMMRMFREIRILFPGEDLGVLQLPLLPHYVREAICLDHTKWLAAFLIPEFEVEISRVH